MTRTTKAPARKTATKKTTPKKKYTAQEKKAYWIGVGAALGKNHTDEDLERISKSGLKKAYDSGYGNEMAKNPPSIEVFTKKRRTTATTRTTAKTARTTAKTKTQRTATKPAKTAKAAAGKRCDPKTCKRPSPRAHR